MRISDLEFRRVLFRSRQSQAAGATQRVQAPDPDGEWRLAAQWAAGQLAQNPKGRYAIVAARLEADVVLAHQLGRASCRERAWQCVLISVGGGSLNKKTSKNNH